MKCIILAAGYATRLYPLTENFPKPLLDVNGKTIIDWLVDDVECSDSIDQYIIVSNDRFYNHFVNWKETKSFKDRITILNDGSTDNDNRLGAVKDIAYAIEKYSLDDDLLVLAGDNVLDFSLGRFIDYFKEKNTTIVMRYHEPELARLQRTGVALIDENQKIINMEEKPKEPKSNWAVPPFYVYKRDDIKYVIQGIQDECDTDAPGSFIAWLCTKCDVHAFQMPGKRYDIGNLESYKKVQEEYKGINV